MSISDVQKEKSLLSKLKENRRAASVRGKIVTIPKELTRFVCPNHPTKTIIDMHESGQRKENNKMTEFECTCGTIYIKE